MTNPSELRELQIKIDEHFQKGREIKSYFGSWPRTRAIQHVIFEGSTWEHEAEMAKELNFHLCRIERLQQRQAQIVKEFLNHPSTAIQEIAMRMLEIHKERSSSLSNPPAS